MKSILLIKKLLGLVEMMSGLVNASFSLPEWLAVKMIFLCTLHLPPPLDVHTHTHTHKRNDSIFIESYC